MTDPLVVVAIVNAAGGLLQKALAIVIDAKPDKEVDRVLSKTYDKLAGEVTTNSLRVLLALRKAGSYQTPNQIRSAAVDMTEQQEPDGIPFESNLTYRLKFLCLLGLVQTSSGLDFALTRLGAAFIKHAREDQLRYSKAFPL